MPILFHRNLVVYRMPNLEFNFLNIKLLKATKKSFLPQKTCLVCERPFTWRKKWEKVWADVKYCSDKCKMNKKQKI